jgi:hypothetical protein
MGSVRAFRRLNAGSSSSVSGASWTLGGKGRRANSCGMAGCCTGAGMGVTTREVTGVTARDDRGLFFDLGLEGACRKSSGISFQLSIADGTGVVVEEMRFGAEADLRGGGGRFGGNDTAEGEGLGCSVVPLEVGFFSQPFKEDCNMVERGVFECEGWVGLGNPLR